LPGPGALRHLARARIGDAVSGRRPEHSLVGGSIQKEHLSVANADADMHGARKGNVFIALDRTVEAATRVGTDLSPNRPCPI